MGCLYCGKEIGLVRQIRDREFCSSAHRKGYGARLGKALQGLAAPAPAPAPVADFRNQMPLQSGNLNYAVAVFGFGPGSNPIHLRGTMPLSIAGVRGQSAKPLAGSHGAPFAPDLSARSHAGPSNYSLELQFPRFELAAEDGMPVLSGDISEGPPLAGAAFWEIPEACDAARTMNATPVERKTTAILEPAAMSMVAAPLVIGIRGLLTAPSAEVVEAFLPLAPYAADMAFPASATMTQPFVLEAVDDLAAAPEICGAVAAAAAEVVEAFLPQAPYAAQMAFPPAIAKGSAWALQPVNDWAIPDMCGAMPAAAAEAVEAFLPQTPFAAHVAHPATVAMGSDWALQPVGDWPAVPEEIVPELSGLMPAAAAEAVEAFLPLAPYAAEMAFPAAAAMAGQWIPEAIREASLTLEVCGVMQAPAAEVVETFLPTAFYAAQVAFPAPALMAGAWIPEPIVEVSLKVEGCGTMSAPASEVVEALLPPAPYGDAVGFPAGAAATALAWMLEPADRPSRTLEICGAFAAPAAEAAETLFPATPMAEAAAFAASAVRLPEMLLAAVQSAETETAKYVSEPMDVVPPSESWMTPPPACEAEREVWPVMAAALPLEAAVQAPGAAALSIAEPIVHESGGWRPASMAEPVAAYISARLAESIDEVALEPTAYCVPDLAGLGRTAKQQSAFTAPAAQQQMPMPASPDAGSSLTAEPAAAADAGVIRFPGLVLAQATGSSAGAFRVSEAGAAVPETAFPDSRAAWFEPLSTISIVPPATGAGQPGAALPQGQLLPMEFFCQRAPMAPKVRLTWLTKRFAAVQPKFAMRTAFDRLEDLALVDIDRERETPSFTEIFNIANAKRRAQPSRLRTPMRAVAAALLIGVGLWFGAGSAKIGRRMSAVNTNWPSVETPSSSAPSAAFSRVRSVFVPQSPQSSDGPIEKVRRAIQSRAAAELSDTFRGMEAWGASAAALPEGWTRHPDGYMRTGALALYHPSLNFTDYRLEFFGQIESKAIGWTVRASNTQNYYGMKFKVIEPGLRPVLAVVHYPVVGGTEGARVETPLNVMIHNRTPYHIAVEVKGNRVTTSIEGEEVDSWTDDSLKVGGVGFFSDAGESAHLYWMKITKNQDWLGRVCAYLSGNAGSTETGEMWRDDYAPAPSPRPSPRPSPDAILAAVETDDFPYHSPQRARILTNGRTELCKS